VIPSLKSGALCLCLALSLSACGARQSLPPVEPQIVREQPPESLLQDRVEPVPESRDNEGLANWAIELRCALRQSNADKAALRAWKRGQQYDSSLARARCD
jgi:hypothetical protein